MSALKTGVAVGIMLLAAGYGTSNAQPCFSAPECAVIRQRQEAAAQAQAQAQADAQARERRAAADAANEERRRSAERAAEAKRAVINQAIAQAAAARAQAQADADAEVRMRQAAIDNAAAMIVQQAAADERRRQEEDAASAQLAAEQSPNNRCKDQKFAKRLMDFFNQLQTVKDYNNKAVDIQHLVTSSYTDDTVFDCHGSFVLQNGRQVKGSIVSRQNVAGEALFVFKGD